MMFSFLSNWRPTFFSSDGESDDASSLNRSLSLPWPVTESSPRKNKTEGTPTQQQQLRQPSVNGMNMRDISYPMPKMALKSLTRRDDHPAAGLPGPSAPPASSGTIGTPSLHPFIAAPTPISESVPWFQESAEKKRNKNNNYNLRTALLQANAYAQHASTTSGVNAPPQVVRLDNNPFYPQVDATRFQSPLAGHHPYANGITNPGVYANPYAPQTPHDEDDDEHEIYTSPFEHSDDDKEDEFFQGPLPTPTTATTSTSRWGGLKLHTASPFSQSTLRVDGLIFPSPPDTSSPHLTLPLPGGVFPPSLQQPPGTPPPTVNTDVYNYAYNYPLAKQLSPIAEQDYFSPVSVRGLPASAASASPGAESVINFGFGNGNGNGRTTAEGDKERERERGSIKTRSVRTGSAESTKALAMMSVSRSGSLSMSMREGTTTRDPNPSPSGSTIGSEITRPSPIYASPFITRHLNRTTSQTSSNKSESPSQAQFQQPPPPPPSSPLPPAFAPPVIQSQPQGETQSNGPSTPPTLSRMTSQLSIGSITSTPRLSTVTITPANAYLKRSGLDTTITTTTGAVQTPTSAVTTTTGTMYTPNSAFPAPTPTSPTSATTGIAGVQIPVPAITILPCIPPLDFRPFFPGPHPSPNLSPTESGVPRLRPPKMRKKREDAGHRLSVIRGSGTQSDAEDISGHEEEEVVVDDEVEVEDEEGEEEGGGYDIESLHADSFVTATTNSNEDDEDDDEDDDENDEIPIERGVELTRLAKGKTASLHYTPQLPSATLSHSGSGNSTTGDSFITRRWDRDAALGLSLSLSPTTFRERKHRFFKSNSSFITNLTPAFWAFWLGFVFPVLWLVGGWHFTSLGEQPPKLTVWEWYFWRMKNGWGGLWKRVVVGWCCGIRKGGNHKRGGSQQQQQIQIQMQQGPQRRIPTKTRPRTKSLSSYSHSKLRSGKVFPALPRWVAEKQSSDDGRMRLNDPKRSLKGISFGYPFIPRPPYSQESTTLSSSAPPLSVAKRVLMWIEKPNRVLDQLYGIKLREVRGRPESGRRMFDPWIQRCRYAFCWMMLVVAIGLCTASVYLIVVNTRRL